jgi:hypothetical protein
VLGNSFVFVVLVQILHMFSYKGMGIFSSVSGSNTATQLWIAARGLYCLSFILAGLLVKKRITIIKITGPYAVLTALILGSIYLHVFPECYNEQTGLTMFKIVTEYVIIAGFVVAVIGLYKIRCMFDEPGFKYLLYSLVLNIVAELSFTLYTGVYDWFNRIGHLLVFGSVYLIYRVAVLKSIIEPQTIIFKELKDSEKQLREKVSQLETFTDIAVGRELRMVELETEIERLKKQVK